jgi:hypothetical protein
MENVTACPERRSSALTATITELVCFEKKAPDSSPDAFNRQPNHENEKPLSKGYSKTYFTNRNERVAK